MYQYSISLPDILGSHNFIACLHIAISRYSMDVFREAMRLYLISVLLITFLFQKHSLVSWLNWCPIEFKVLTSMSQNIEHVRVTNKGQQTISHDIISNDSFDPL